MYRSYTSFIKFIFKYFIYFDIIKLYFTKFQFQISCCSNTDSTEFCILHKVLYPYLYPAFLLNSLISSKGFLQISQPFTYRQLYLHEQSKFYSSFAICIFFCMIALAKFVSTVLNRNDQNNYPQFFLVLRGKIQPFSTGMELTVIFYRKPL